MYHFFDTGGQLQSPAMLLLVLKKNLIKFRWAEQVWLETSIWLPKTGAAQTSPDCRLRMLLPDSSQPRWAAPGCYCPAPASSPMAGCHLHPTSKGVSFHRFWTAALGWGQLCSQNCHFSPQPGCQLRLTNPAFAARHDTLQWAVLQLLAAAPWCSGWSSNALR